MPCVDEYIPQEPQDEDAWEPEKGEGGEEGEEEDSEHDEVLETEKHAGDTTPPQQHMPQTTDQTKGAPGIASDDKATPVKENLQNSQTTAAATDLTEEPETPFPSASHEEALSIDQHRFTATDTNNTSSQGDQGDQLQQGDQVEQPLGGGARLKLDEANKPDAPSAPSSSPSPASEGRPSVSYKF